MFSTSLSRQTLPLMVSIKLHKKQATGKVYKHFFIIRTFCWFGSECMLRFQKNWSIAFFFLENLHILY